MKQLSATELKVTQKVSASNENSSASRRQEVVARASASQQTTHQASHPRTAQAAKAKSRGKTIDLPLSSQQLKNRNGKTSQTNLQQSVIETYSPAASVQTNSDEPSMRVGSRQAKTGDKRIKEKISISIPTSSAQSSNDVAEETMRFKRAKHRSRQPSGLTKALLYGSRLAIVGIGIGAIAGTVLSALDPTNRIQAQQQAQVPQPEVTQAVVVPGSALQLAQEMAPLKTTIQQLAAKQKGLTPGVFFLDLDTGAYVDVNGNTSFASASMIKFPVLVAFFQDVDAGKIRLDERLTLKKELIGGGAGEMQYKSIGSKFTALETATKMITISDNTATNLLIARMGGATALNQRFISWGLTTTQIRNLLPDLEGTNTTSPRDLAQLMALVDRGDLIKPRSRDRLLDIMRRTVTNTLLPRGLGEDARIAHKTGDIGSLVGDVGLIDMPTGKRYIGVAMVKRPHNDGRAQELIRQISRATYQELNKPNVDQVLRTTPFVTTNTQNSTTNASPSPTSGGQATPNRR